MQNTQSAIEPPKEAASAEAPMRCGFCYDREQGKHGAIKREWCGEWNLFIPLCRKHSVDAKGNTV
jgi:hypothetical protein